MEEIKQSLFTDDLLAYVENLKEFTKNKQIKPTTKKTSPARQLITYTNITRPTYKNLLYFYTFIVY